MRHAKSAIACCLLAVLVGCPGPRSSSPKPGPSPLEGARVRLVVVADPQMAATIEPLRGEWTTQTGADFQLRRITEEELAAARQLAADAIICPSYTLGTLAEQGLVGPIPEGLLDDDAGDWSEAFELPKLREAAWGPEIHGVALGSPVLTCYYRADLLEELARPPPETWEDYHRLARLLADRGRAAAAEGAPWSGALEPLGPGWAGLVLLARAAPYGKHRDNYSTLFDIRTMEPLIAGPPFVRALEELVAGAKLGSHQQTAFDPAAVRKAFWQGQCGLALSWPTRAAEVPAGEAIRVGFAELPGSREVYNVGSGSWEFRAEEEEHRVPLLGVAGRMGVVTADSAHRDAAWQLLLWLSGEQLSGQVCASSPATTLFRNSHVASPQQWVEKPVSSAAAGQYASLTKAALQRRQWLCAPRIPGRADYLAALDEAVQAAVRGTRSPGEALRGAAARWREITRRAGRAKQRAAYLRSLGLEGD